MSNVIDEARRDFLVAAAAAIAAARLGEFDLARSRSSVTLGPTTPLGPVKQIDAGVLNVGYAEAGPAGGRAVILLHGWPYDIHAFDDVTPLLAAAGFRVIVPYLRGYGTTKFQSSDAFRTGQPSAVALDIVALMDALKIQTAIIGGFDWGARTANIIGALWPERCKAMVSVSGYLIGSQASGRVPLPPAAELQWWYQFYFATDRGQAGYDKYRHDFNKLIWQLASPKWRFDDATFDRTAALFDNPDHVRIVIHNYRWRLGLVQGDPKYDAIDAQLAKLPTIAVPTMTLEGDANGAPHGDASTYANKFTGKYAHRVIDGGMGTICRRKRRRRSRMRSSKWRDGELLNYREPISGNRCGMKTHGITTSGEVVMPCVSCHHRFPVIGSRQYQQPRLFT